MLFTKEMLFNMKFRMLVHALESLLCAVRGEDDHPADMFLPEKLLSMALVFFAAAVIASAAAVIKGHSMIWYLIAAAALTLGAAAFLCWRNQKICMLSDEEFTYTTMFGKTTVYRFEDIVALKKNKDSFTLILKNGKVHIESMAVLSDRLIRRIDDVFR